MLKNNPLNFCRIFNKHPVCKYLGTNLNKEGTDDGGIKSRIKRDK